MQEDTFWTKDLSQSNKKLDFLPMYNNSIIMCGFAQYGAISQHAPGLPVYHSLHYITSHVFKANQNPDNIIRSIFSRSVQTKHNCS